MQPFTKCVLSACLGVFVVVPNISTVIPEPSLEMASLPEIQETKDPVILERLKKLEWCESRGDPAAVGDNSLAYGPLQFHKPTFLAYAKKYNLFPAEPAELENLYYDPDSQRELAYRMLLDGEYRHWWNCSVKEGWIKP